MTSVSTRDEAIFLSSAEAIFRSSAGGAGSRGTSPVGGGRIGTPGRMGDVDGPGSMGSSGRTAEVSSPGRRGPASSAGGGSIGTSSPTDGVVVELDSSIIVAENFVVVEDVPTSLIVLADVGEISVADGAVLVASEVDADVTSEARPVVVTEMVEVSSVKDVLSLVLVADKSNVFDVDN